MKLFLSIALLILFSITLNSSFAQFSDSTPSIEKRLEPISHIELYEKSDIIIEGLIISTNYPELVVEIQTVLKGNPDNTITVYGKGPAEIMSSIGRVFETNDEVLLFLNDDDGNLNISPYSSRIFSDTGPRFFKIPPLKLEQMNVPFEEIFCKSDLVLIKKINDRPACVKPSSVQELKNRGWAL